MDKQQDPTSAPGHADWEKKLIDRFAFEVLKEQRAARRWGIFFKLALLAYLIGISVMSWRGAAPGTFVKADQITALVEVEGLIATDLPAGADSVVTGLRAAFEDERTKGVIVRINSPGGSPVQAGYINDEIHRLREKHPEIPVYAVIQDICASGGYYVAAAANEIYADKASIVGSIGVRMDGFGFVETLDKLGVERRLLTAGEHKAFLDPFSPLKEGEVAHVSGLLSEIHQQFVNTVKRGRGDRLKAEADLFSGLVWTGERGLELGLVDALGSASFVARKIIGAEDIVDFTPRQNVLEQLGRRLTTSVAAGVRESLSSAW
jgi:protease-4